MRRFLWTLAAVLVLADAAQAAVPQKILYQGTMRRSGSIYTGNATFVFRVTDASGGTQYWTSGATVVAVSAGLFRYPLGIQNTGTDDGTFAAINWGGVTPYVEVTVDGNVLLPREPMTAVAYALNAAGTVDSTKVAKTGDTMTGSLMIAGSSLTVTQGISAGSITVSGSLTASSGTFTAAGAAQYSLRTSSGLWVGGGALALGPNGFVQFADGSIQTTAGGGGGSGGWARAATGIIYPTTAGDNVTVVSSLTVQGAGFSVGTSTLAVWNGNVGIGTTAPDRALTIVGSNAAGTRIRVQDTNYSILSLGDDVTNYAADVFWDKAASLLHLRSNKAGAPIVMTAGGSERLRLPAAGQVGVGTSAPSARLHVSSATGETGDIVIVSTGASSLFRVTGEGRVYGGHFFGDGSNLTNVSGSDSSKVAKAGDSMTGGLTVGNNSTMTVQGPGFSVGGTTFAVSMGNVGIGTTAPRALLDVAGQALFGGAAANNASRLVVSNSGATYALQIASGGMQNNDGLLLYAPLGKGVISTNNNIPLVLAVNAVEKARLDGSAGFGMFGSTFAASPGAGTHALHVSSGIVIATGPVTFGHGGFIRFSDGSVQATAVSNSVIETVSGWTRNASGVIYPTTSSDNVTVGATVTVRGADFSVGGSTFVIVAGNVGISSSTPQNLFVVGSGTGALNIQSNGNIGMGTTSPIEKADIIGNLLIRRITSGGAGGRLRIGRSDDPSAALYGEIGYAPTVFYFVNQDATAGTLGALTYGSYSAGAGVGMDLPSNGVIILKVNAGEAMRIDDARRVGIGTSVPTAAFQVGGGTLTVNNGNVGVSTTAPTTTLDVYGSAQFGSGLARSTFTSNPGGNTYALQLSSGIVIATGPITLGAGGFIRFSDGTSQATAMSTATAQSVTGWTRTGSGVLTPTVGSDNIVLNSSMTIQRGSAASPLYVSTSSVWGHPALYVDLTDQVGIGTTKPTEPLEIMAADYKGLIVHGTGQTPTMKLYNDSPNGGSRNWGLMTNVTQFGDFDLRQSAARLGDPATSGISRLHIDNLGYVGIGTVIPAAALHVSSEPALASTPLFKVGVSTLVATGGGNVGIGTTNPVELFQVNRADEGNFLITSVAGAGRHLLTSDGNFNALIRTMNNVDLRLGVNENAVSIKNGGNVGISTITPVATLDVAGSMQVGQTSKSTFTASPGGSTYALMLSSGVNIASGPIVLGDGGFIRFPDGTSQVTAPASAASIGWTRNAAGFISPTTSADNIAIMASSLTVLGSATDSHALRVGNGLVISTGGAITTIGIGHGTVIGNARGTGAVDLQTERNLATNVASGNFSNIGGGHYNTASGFESSVCGGYSNSVSGAQGVICGGSGNSVTNQYSIVAGGVSNSASSNYATVGGGGGNAASGSQSTVAGGRSNTSSQLYASVGGGFGNTSSGNGAVVSGGVSNRAGASNSVVSGGGGNIASASSATVSGGGSNAAGGNYATVPGGFDNTALGDYSFAAGYLSSATHQGSFVWADSQGVELQSEANNQFRVRAGGGVKMSTSTDSNSVAIAVDLNNRVGVGITNPSAALHANGGEGTVASLRVDGSSHTLLNHSGNVGIGTLAPAAHLEVYRNLDSASRIRIENPDMLGTSSATQLEFSEAGTVKGYIGSNNATSVGGNYFMQMVNHKNAPIIFGTNSTERMRLDRSGSLGIAAGNTPAARLHVSSNNAVAADTIFLVSTGAVAAQNLMSVMGDGAVGLGNAATRSTFTAAGYWIPRQMAAATIHAANGVLGAVIQCVDCIRPYTLCVGTGTAADQWREQGTSDGCY